MTPLEQYKNIEEYFGIDFIIIFQALTQGFWVRRPRGSRPQTYSYEFVSPKDDYDVHNEVSLDIYHRCIYDYDNYMQWRCGARRFAYDLKTYRAKKGFAWALTREELKYVSTGSQEEI